MALAFYNSPVLWIGQNIDQALSTYVTTTSIAFSQALTAIAISGLTIWIGLYGAAMVRGESQSPIMGFSWRLALKTIMIACACAGGVYQGTIVPAINDGMLELVQISITASSPGSSTSCALKVSSVMEALDCFDKSKLNILQSFLGANDGLSIADIGSIAENLIACIFIFLSLNALEIILGIEVLFCRVGLQLLLGLGPLFIVCGAFEPTKKYFDGWMNKIVYLAVLNLLVFSFLGLVLSFSAVTLADFQMHPTDVLSWVSSQSLTIMGAAITLFFGYLLFAFLGLRLPSIAGAITGSSGGGSGLMGAVAGFVTAKLTHGKLPSGGNPNSNKNNSVSQGGGAGSASAKTQTPSYQRAASYGRARAARNK